VSDGASFTLGPLADALGASGRLGDAPPTAAGVNPLDLRTALEERRA
jgi:hypothetical protein